MSVSVVGALLAVGLGSVAATAEHTVRHLVVLDTTADLGTAVARHAAVPRQVFTHSVRAYAADLTAAEVARIAQDPHVAAVVPDLVFTPADDWPLLPDAPTDEPTDAPTDEPTDAPTDDPTDDPTDEPTEPGQVSSTGLQRIGGPARVGTGVDGAPPAPVDADIAIIDSGVDATHTDLTVAGVVDCADSGTTEPSNPHATHLAGIAAAVDNDTGVLGVAPGARIWSIRVADADDQILLSYLLCATEWVVAHAEEIEVANVSLSGPMLGPAADCGMADGVLVDPLHQSICAAVDAGVTYAVAAGNAESDARLSAPAAYPEVITVSAYADFDGLPGGEAGPDCEDEPLPEDDDTLAFFSNHGPLVDLAAPGVCIVSTFPDDALGILHGTSMAAPHVAGAAALVAAADPTLTPAQIRDLLVDLGEPGPLAEDPDPYPEPLLRVSDL